MPHPLTPREEFLYPLNERPDGPTACLDISEMRKPYVSTGVQNPYLASCSIVTITCSLRLLSEQRLVISTPCRVLYV